jgi:hypothetical protein
VKIAGVDKRDGMYWHVTFERDGDHVSKLVRVSDLERKCAKDAEDLNRYWLYNLQKSAREADRDLAYRKHGATFRDHCEYKDNFWSLLPPEEMKKLFLDV